MTHRFDREVAQIDPGLLQLDRLETLQVNLGNVCNQRCRHCHVQAGPDGKKIMTRPVMVKILDFLRDHPGLCLDMTGGCPELNPDFRFLLENARGILDYVLRDMTDPAGGFYSAEDADSEDKEGTFYLWTPREINDLLDKDHARVFSDYYGLTKKGNFEEGKTILSVRMSVEELAEKHNISPSKARHMLQSAGRILFDARAQRPRPYRDEKIIAGTNGLMISALAMGGRIHAECHNHIPRRRPRRASNRGSRVLR